MILLKARKYAVGTIRRWKSGKYLKTKPGHWKLLTEIVRNKQRADEVHPNHASAKSMLAASRQLVRFLAQSRGSYSRDVADKWLDEKYSHLNYKRFGLWKRRVIESVEKYLTEISGIYGDESVRNPTEQFKKVSQWQDALKRATTTMTSDVERDQWVANQFAKAKKPIAHILYASREIIGRSTPMTMVPDSGFRGLCKAIIQKVYEHGPAGMSKDQIMVFEKAFRTFFQKAETGSKPLRLEQALSQAHTKPFFKANPKWFVYCCTRQAMKNDGWVDLSSIESYMKNAMKYHGSKNPPSPSYDYSDASLLSQVRLKLVSPDKAKQRAGSYMPSSKTQSIKKLYLKHRRKK